MTNLSRPKLTILYVESNPQIFDQFKKQLNCQQENPAILQRAESCEKALEQLRKGNLYEVLMLDCGHDDKQALEFHENLRQMKCQTPLVLLTDSVDDQLEQKAYAAGIALVIQKSQKQFGDIAALIYQVFCGGKKSGPKKKSSSKASSSVSAQAQDMENREAVTKDSLTGVFNHSFLFEKVAEEFERAKRHAYPLACMVVDIDHFKYINEKWDYQTGDDLLKESVQLLFSQCRVSDFVARYGGEEFAIVMPHTDYEGAARLADRLNNVFSEHIFLKGRKDIKLTISVGVCAFPEDVITQKSELLTFAVQALYRSKASGRNKMTLYRDILPVFGKDDLPVLKISDEKVVDFQRRISEIASAARKTYIDAAKMLIMVMENKDSFTAGHAASVAKGSAETAEAMGLDLDEVEMIEHAALLHDIGKICIPDEVLLKNGKLTFAEFETMRQHAYLGYKILKPLKFLDHEALLVLHHHEWYNGEGYPCRLKGTSIPLGARIISVVDSYDTMRAAGGRYKKTCTVEHAVNELIACSGVQFDPRVVKAFINVLIKRGDCTPDCFDKERLDNLIAGAEAEQPQIPRIY